MFIPFRMGFALKDITAERRNRQPELLRSAMKRPGAMTARGIRPALKSSGREPRE